MRCKRCQPIWITQGLNLQNRSGMSHKTLLTLFTLLAEPDCDFASERTKEALRAWWEQGLVFGTPKGVVQRSVYDASRERIWHLAFL
jgi:hypothetical protein